MYNLLTLLITCLLFAGITALLTKRANHATTTRAYYMLCACTRVTALVTLLLALATLLACVYA